MDGVGKWLILAGIALVLIGLLAQAGLLSWLGRLPGDLQIERPGFSFYFPLTTMIVVSVALSLVLQIVRRFF
jgi:hypothetical protein